MWLIRKVYLAFSVGSKLEIEAKIREAGIY